MTKAERFSRLTCNAHVQRDLKGSSVRAATFTWAAGAADFILRLGSTAVLARLILPEQFGLVMMVTAVTSIADQFRDLGLSSATMQRKEIIHQEVSNLFWINAGAGLLIALAICSCSPLISLYYKDSRLTLVTCVLATNFLWGGLLVQHQALLARQLKLGHSAAVRVSASTLSTLVAILLAWLGFGYWALVWREVLRNLMLVSGMWACMPWVPSLPCRKTDIRSLLGFGTHMAGANILGSLTGAMDRVLLGRFQGASPVAMYRQAYQLLVMPMDQLLSPVYQVTQPGLSLVQADPPRFRRFYQKVLTVVGLATMPLSAFVGVYSTEITRVLLGPRWVDSAPLLSLLSIGTFIKQPVSSSAYIPITRGHSKVYFRLAIVQNLTLIALMCVGVRWGTRGVALADVATTYLLIAPTLFLCLRGSPVSFRDFVAPLSRPVVASLAMVMTLLAMRHGLPALGMAASLALGCVAAPLAFLGVWLLLPGGRSELVSLVSDVWFALQKRRKARQAAEPVAVATEA